MSCTYEDLSHQSPTSRQKSCWDCQHHFLCQNVSSCSLQQVINSSVSYRTQEKCHRLEEKNERKIERHKEVFDIKLWAPIHTGHSGNYYQEYEIFQHDLLDMIKERSI